jgi:hypothetical protein
MRMTLLLVVMLTSTAAHADAGDRWDGVMMAEQAGGGLLGGALLGAAGLGIGMGLGQGLGEQGNWGAPLFGAFVGGTLGAVSGVTIGVHLVGDHRGGNGTWLATAAGATLGGLLTFATLPSYGDKVPTPVAFSLASVTMLAPAILAYHLSSDENASTEKRVVVPLLLVPF